MILLCYCQYSPSLMFFPTLIKHLLLIISVLLHYGYNLLILMQLHQSPLLVDPMQHFHSHLTLISREISAVKVSVDVVSVFLVGGCCFAIFFLWFYLIS